MVIAVFISLFIYLVPTSPSFIRIQFKTVRFVGVISAFYKAFVGFSSRSIELILNRSPSYDELPSLSNFKLIQPKKIVAVLFFFPVIFNKFGGGRETRSGTEKRCSHNLQGGQPSWWSAGNWCFSVGTSYMIIIMYRSIWCRIWVYGVV